MNTLNPQGPLGRRITDRRCQAAGPLWSNGRCGDTAIAGETLCRFHKVRQPIVATKELAR